MARRVALPEPIRSQLHLRAAAGIGHDPEHPTLIGAGSQARTVPASQAMRQAPSPQTLGCVKAVAEHVRHAEATHIDITSDLARTGDVGALTVRWMAGPSAASVAEVFAVSHADDGTPLVPSWLNLRADGDFDLRWQPGF